MPLVYRSGWIVPRPRSILKDMNFLAVFPKAV
jgi:hypothetical protein